MKKNSMRLLWLLLAVVMVSSLLTVGIFADDTGTPAVAANGNVAKVGNTEYATIDEAIAAWTNNTTLTLLSDVTLSDVVTLKSTEHHILNLGTYTLTAASGKNAFVIQACGTGDAERTALTINADATNPGGINAGSKSIVYYNFADGGITGNDRPIIKINGGVFTGSTSAWGTAGIYFKGGTAAKQAATLNISGGTFNCTINGQSKSKLIITGGTFNYSVGSQGDSTANRLISGGTFKTLGFMTADSNNTKFWIGTSMGNSNVGVHVDDNGYIVVGGPVVTEAGETFEASSANYGGASSYLQYSSAQNNGLYYTSVEEAFADNNEASGSVTVYVDELDMTGINYKGTIVVPKGETIKIVTEEGETPTWTVSAAEGAVVKYTDADGNELVKDANGQLVEKITEVATYDELVAALAEGGKIKLTADITVDTKITAIDGTTIDLNDETLYINVENSFYNNVTIKNGNIVLGKDDVHVCDGYFEIVEGKTLVLDNVNVSSAEGGIKGYAVFHLKTGANLDLVNCVLNISDNEYAAGYIVYAGESTATVDIENSTVTGSKVNGIVHATTVIKNYSTFTITNAIEHGINRSRVTITDSTVSISGGTGRGITAQHGPLVIDGNSTVTIEKMGEATIELRNNQDLTIADTATVKLDAAVNNTTSGTITGTVILPPMGTVTHAYTGTTSIWGEATGNASKSFAIKLYSGETLLVTATLNDPNGVIIDGNIENVTWNIPLNSAGNDSWWTVEWAQYITVDLQPTKVVAVVDGVEVATNTFVLNAPDDLKQIYAAVTDNSGKILSFHTDIQEAIKAAAAVNSVARTAAVAGTVEILRDVTVDKWIMFAEKMNIGNGKLITLNINGLTIDGNGHTLTVKSIESASNGNRLFYDAQNLNIKDLTIQYVDAAANQGGIGLQSGTINDVTFIGGGNAILPGNGEVTISDCTFECNGHAIYFEEARDNLVVTGNTFKLADTTNVILLRGDMEFTNNTIVSGRTVNVVSGSPVVTGNNFNDVRLKVYNGATANISNNTINNLVFNETDAPADSTFANNTLSADAQAALDALPVLAGTGTAADPYIIKDIEGLKWFRDQVNAGNTFAGKTVKLAADINLNNEEWTPIGNSTNKFQGIFDGQEHIISNLLITGTKSNVGLFGFTINGEIKNLTVNNAKVSGRLNVGVVAGTPYTSKYTNIKVTGHVEVNGMAYVGGVGGKNAYANWTDITVDVDDTSYVKAVSTENDVAYRTYVGGVIGFIGEGGHTFTNISSNITVIGDVCDIGGLFGIAHYGNNFVNVSCSADVKCTGEADEIGGIAGVWNNTKGYTVTFSNAAFTGTVTDVNGEVENVDIVGGAYHADNETPETSGSLKIDGVEAWLCVATINGVKYPSLQAAIDACAKDPIVLVCDVTENITIPNGATIVLDLNGKTLNGYIAPCTPAALTIKGGSIVNTNAGYSAIEINAGKLDLINVNIESARHGVRIDGAVEATIDGGEYTVNATSGTRHAVNVSGAANVIIKNGTFVGPKGTTMDSGSAVCVQAGAKVTIEGGSFSKGKNATLGVTGTMVVTGGTFDQDPTAYLAEGYMVQKNADGLYVVVKAVAKIGDTYYKTLADAFAAIGSGDVVIELLADATFDYNARDAYGLADTNSITINGNGYTLTLNQKNSDWASLGMANANGKLVINNATIEKTGYGDTNGAWNTHAIIFSCNVEMTDVTVNNGIAVQNGATLNNVTINEANAYYGLWINGNGQTVTVNGGEINATNGGRGIKIADQYIDAPKSVILNVTGTEFNTAKKAAVLVSSKAGAVITADGVDITKVAEDDVNFVWVDEDWAAYFGEVTVNGCTVAQEAAEDFEAALVKNGKIQSYYKTLAEAIKAAEAGDTVTVFAGTYAVPSLKAGITIEGVGDVLFEGTLSGTLENLTLKNIHIKGANAQRWGYAKGDLVFENVTFEATSVYALHFDGIKEGTTLLFKDCTIIGWAAMGGTPASCVFEGCTIKGNGSYGVIRTYFDATIVNCTFDVDNVNTGDVYQDGIHAVGGATVTVNNCTNVNGAMSDLVNVSGSSVIIVDGVKYQNAAKIGDTYYATVADAFAAAKDGDEVVILVAGNYAVPTGKNITVTGAVEGVTFGTIGAVNMGGASVTFNNVTFNYAITSTYKGLQHSGNLVYNSCTFNGQVFLYGESETFNNCTFNQTSANAYNVWTYGGKTVEFNECTFNSVGKSVLIYSESKSLYNDVTFTDCVFAASAPVDGKAAIEMDSSLTAGINLTINNATVTGMGIGNVSGNSLWNNKKGSNTDANNDITVTVDGKVVLAPVTFVAKIGDTGYTSFADAIKAANAGETVTILAGNYTTDVTVNKAITVVGETDENGNNLVNIIGRVSASTGSTVMNLNVHNTKTGDYDCALVVNGKDIVIDGVKLTGYNAMRYCYATGDITIKNSTINGSNFAVHFDGSAGGNIVIENCDITGWVSYASTINSVSYTDCSFDQGKYEGHRYYNKNVSFTECDFADGFQIELKASGSNVAFTDADMTMAEVKALFADPYYVAKGNITLNNEKATYVASAYTANGSKYFDSLQDAINEVNNGGYITVRSDIVLTAPITVPAGKEVEIGLGDFNITYTSDVMGQAMITNNGELTLSGDGKIVYTYTGAADSAYGKGNYTIANNGKLTIDGVTVENATAAMKHASYAITNGNGGEIVLEDGLILNTNNYAVRMFGKGSLTVEDGEIKGTRAVWMQAPGSNTADAPAISLTVNGGKLTATGESAEYKLAVYSYTYGNSLANVSITVTGGVVDGDIALGGGKNKTESEKVTITGGTITNIYSYAADEVAALTVNVSGGIFKNAVAEAYCAEGFIPEANPDGTYGVKAGKYVARNSTTGVGYETLAEAVDAAKAGDTIVLLENTIGSGIVINKSITIDLNSFTYTVNKTVGSTGTTTLGFQILKDNDVIIKNGTLAATAVVEGKSVKMLVQNYANLTLTDVVLDGTGSAEMLYVLSNNSGNILINGATSITAPEGAVAFDVCKYASYEAPVVTVNTTGKITGKIEVTDAISTNLNIEGGTFTAKIAEAWCANSFVPTVNADGTYTVMPEDDAVAKIGDVYFATLANAIKAAKDGDTVTLLADYSNWKMIQIGKSITLDLNTYTINRTFGGIALDITDGTVTIVGGGKISGSTTAITVAYDAELILKKVTVEGRDGHGVDNDGKLTIDGATITATEYGVALYSGDSYAASVTMEGGSVSGQYGIAAYANTTVTVNGGKISGTVAGLSGEGGSHGTTFTVNGGEIVSENGVGIYHPQNGTLTITDGTISGATGINMKSGTLNVSGGTIEGTGAKADYSFVGGGFNSTGDALVLENCKYPGGAPVASITGGTFTSVNAQAVASYAGNGVTEAVGGFISGGSFSTPVTAAYCAEGYIPVKNTDGTYGVLPQSQALVSVDGVYFASWAEAKAAIKKSSVIKLYADVTETQIFSFASKFGNIQIDLNGHVLTCKRFTVGYDTSLTVKDSSDGAPGKLVITDFVALSQRTFIDMTDDTEFVGVLQLNYMENQAYSFRINGKAVIGSASIGCPIQYSGTARVKMTDNYSNITLLMGKFVVASDYVTSAGKTVTVAPNITLTVPAGVTLNLDATTDLVINGTLNVEGTLVVNSFEHFKQFLNMASVKNLAVGSTIVIDEDYVLDLAGRTILVDGINTAPAFRVLANVTVKNGTVDATTGINSYAFIVGNYTTAGELTIVDGTYKGITSVISITNGVANIEGGEFMTAHDDEGTDYGATYLLNCMDAAYKNGTAVYNITGGTFYGFNPQNNAAEGQGTNFLSMAYGYIYDADKDAYTVKAGAAYIEETEIGYATLQDAIAAAKDGDTIILLSDLTLGKDDVTLLDGSYNTFFLVEGKTVTIDLNGKTIKVDAAGMDKMLVGVFSTDNGGHLTLNDTAGGAVVEAVANGAKVYSLIANYEPGCSITINGGTYTLDKASDSLIYTGCDAGEGEGVVVNGGNFTLGNVGTGKNESPWIFNAKGQNTANVIVTGGTFNSNICGQYYAHEVDILDANGNLSYVIDNKNGTWTVTGLAAEVAIMLDVWGNYDYPVGYATFADAIKSIVKGQAETTIVLQKDITVKGQFIGHSYAQNVVIDLNGYKMSSTDKALTVYRAGTTVLIKNGTVHGNTTGGTIQVTYGGKLTLGENVTITCGGSANALKVDANSTLIIADETVKVLGGKNDLIVADNATVEISAGLFKHPVNADWCAKWYAPTDKLENGYYSVYLTAQATVTDKEGNVTHYETLGEAIAAAVDGSVITLNHDVSLTYADAAKVFGEYRAFFVITDKSITIDLNGKTIFGDAAGAPKIYNGEDYPEAMLLGVFTTIGNGHLTLKDSSNGQGTVEIKAGTTDRTDDGKTYTYLAYSLLMNYDDDCSIVVEGGRYIADDVYDALVYTSCDTVVDDDGEIVTGVIVDGGYFYLTNVGKGSRGNGSPWIFNARGQHIRSVVVKGGTFNANVNAQYWVFEVDIDKSLALAYDKETGTWTIVPAVAYVNKQHWASSWYTRETGYATLEEAFAALEGIKTKTVGKKVHYSAQDYVTVLNATPEDAKDILESAKDGDVVAIPAGTYTSFPASSLKAGVTVICPEGTVFEGKSALNVNGATVVGATFANVSGSAASGTVNGTFKNCTFEGSNALRYCYAGETVVFENCTFSGDVYGIHFDGGANDVVFKNCTFSGFNAMGSALTKLTMENCTFVANSTSGYNGINLWGDTEMIGCTFVFDGSVEYEWIDLCSADKTATFTNCVVTDGTTSKSVAGVVGKRYDNATIIVDGVEQ